MFEVAIEILRAIIAGAIFFYMRGIREKDDFHLRKGWIYAMIGFGLIFFGSLLDITDHFPGMDKYVILGKTNYEDFLEQVVGYTFGFGFVALGIMKWIPNIIALRHEEKALKNSLKDLQTKIDQLTAEHKELYDQIQQRKS